MSTSVVRTFIVVVVGSWQFRLIVGAITFAFFAVNFIVDLRSAREASEELPLWTYKALVFAVVVPFSIYFLPYTYIWGNYIARFENERKGELE